MEASRRTTEEGRKRQTAGRTIAQSFCLIIGAGLVAVGVLGFFFGGSGFSTGSGIEGEQFLGLEVNGWHNVVHIATGAFLLLMMPTARSAAAGALIFGALYVPVTIWGFVDDSIANIVAINTADNWLHLVLAALGLVVGATGGALFESGRRRQRADAGEGVTRQGTVSTAGEREGARRR